MKENSYYYQMYMANMFVTIPASLLLPSLSTVVSSVHSCLLPFSIRLFVLWRPLKLSSVFGLLASI
ncbi:hypothetical protein BDV19DRAFT_355097 [Aspergillus venezuelensis]